LAFNKAHEEDEWKLRLDVGRAPDEQRRVIDGGLEAGHFTAFVLARVYQLADRVIPVDKVFDYVVLLGLAGSRLEAVDVDDVRAHLDGAIVAIEDVADHLAFGREEIHDLGELWELVFA